MKRKKKKKKKNRRTETWNLIELSSTQYPEEQKRIEKIIEENYTICTQPVHQAKYGITENSHVWPEPSSQFQAINCKFVVTAAGFLDIWKHKLHYATLLDYAVAIGSCFQESCKDTVSSSNINKILTHLLKEQCVHSVQMKETKSLLIQSQKCLQP